MGANNEKLIYKVTKPYIHEGVIALVTDAILGNIVYSVTIICYREYIFALWVFAPMVFMAVVFDAPLMIKCLIDRKKQIVVETTGIYEDTYHDFSLSNKISRENDSVLTTWYYPKEWNMQRVKPAFRTTEGKLIKPRCVMSYAHEQDTVFMNIRGIQRKSDEPIMLKVRYLKYSKAILSVQMISYPNDMKRRTKEYIDSNLADILRWMIKV